MGTQTKLIREQIAHLLTRQPGLSARQLQELTQVSQATLSRHLTALADRVLPVGEARARRYHALRRLRSGSSRLVVHRIDTQGQALPAGQAHLLAPEGMHLPIAEWGWPLDDTLARGVWPGLAYPLADMRPQGFLGRAVARQWASELGVPSNPREWHDDDVLYALEQRGHDMPGDLIVGEPALQRWLHNKANPPHVWRENERAAVYVDLAINITAQGAVGSSAGGEFPKFTTLRDVPGCATEHVIVKFSGGDAGGAAQRWRDLLVCEHLALQTLRERTSLPTAHTQLLHAQGRTFLEIERFDRHGLWGRSPLCSLQAINDALLGVATADWGSMGERLQAHGWTTPETAAQMRWLWWFGTLIGNTDMHQGNVSFAPQTSLQLAPVYDMLPMLYAPLTSGEVPSPVFAPALPTPSARDIWLQACDTAMHFWQRCAEDARISPVFAGICSANRQRLESLRAQA